MNYDTQRTSISRTPVALVVITLDYCGRTFGSSPCLATGEPCYNTYPTCRYKSAFLKQSKDYEFTSADAPLPFRANERPYIKNIKYLPCEIKDNLTVNARVTVEFYDEPDTDVGIDPYVSQRSLVQGTFWKKLIARNHNYKDRQVRIYEGFSGLAKEDFCQTWVGTIDNITLGKGVVKIEVVDLLKSISNIEIPPKLEIKLVTDITSSDTSITLTTVDGLDAPGYLRIGDEIIKYTALDALTNQVTGCTRGYFSTTADEASADAKVQKVRYYAPANPFDILKEMLLTDAGISSNYVDSDAFDYWRDWPAWEVNFSAVVSEPTKLDKLYFEILDIIDCKSWIAEDLKITIRRNLPNVPGREYHYLSDEANIIHDSASVDLNNKSRITRILMYWNKDVLGKLDEVKSYDRLDIVVDADAESANEYNDVIEKKFFCRWIQSGYIQEELLNEYIKNNLMRQTIRQRAACPVITLDVEMKDSNLKTGDYVKLSTDEILLEDGSPIVRASYQVVKRDLKAEKINLKLLRAAPRKIAVIGPADLPDYINASDADKEYCYIGDASGRMPDGEEAYYIW